MSLSTRSLILGVHAFFLPDGNAITVPGVGTASRTNKPGAAEPTYIDLGIVADGEIELSSDEKEIWASTPGKRRLYDVIETNDDMKISITTEELSAFAVEALVKSLALTSASTQFNPLEGKTKKGWLKVQAYDQDDTLVISLEVFVKIRFSGGLKIAGGDVAQPKFEARVLHSIYNTGTL